MAKTIVYSTETCPWCHTAKDFLKENNIEFTSKDISKDPQARTELLQKTGQLAVPVLDISGTIIIGFDQEAIEKALNL